jgi:hypothetical protein
LYFNDKLAYPVDIFVSAHAAEVLRQVEGVKIPTGDWVEEDSCFGSILSAESLPSPWGTFNVGN